jgi:hypothetical protein
MIDCKIEPRPIRKLQSERVSQPGIVVCRVAPPVAEQMPSMWRISIRIDHMALDLIVLWKGRRDRGHLPDCA